MAGPLTQARLKELFCYDEQTGHFMSLKRRGRVPAGYVSRARDGKGRVSISIDNYEYRVHRLAWFYTFGRWPKEIDHINGDPSDNRLCNLREATRLQQMANLKKPITNKSGKKGVSWHKKGRKWQVHIKVNGVNLYLGLFEDLEAAHAAYRNAAIENNGEYARAE